LGALARFFDEEEGFEEEEDFEEWDGKRKGKRGVKPAVSKPTEKKKGKTAKRGKRREFDEEEFDDFSFR